MRPTEGTNRRADEPPEDTLDGISQPQRESQSSPIDRLTDFLIRLDEIERELDALLETAPVR